MLPGERLLISKQLASINFSAVVLYCAARLSGVSPWLTVVCTQPEGGGQEVGEGASGVEDGVSVGKEVAEAV